jgi:hypothetical protein
MRCEGVPADTSTFAAFRITRACALGFSIPESELRNQFETVNGSVGPLKTPDWVVRAIGQQQLFRKGSSNIRVPGRTKEVIQVAAELGVHGITSSLILFR